MKSYRIGIDVGGTHTDMVLIDSESGSYRIEKLPSTPHNPSIAVLDGLRRFIAAGVEPGRIAFFSHGTTATTNALLELKGARTGLLINRAMRGILEVQTQGRDNVSPFDHLFRRPQPLVRPAFVREIGGRIDWRGDEIERLDEAAIAEAVQSLASQGVTSFGICFLFSFMNGQHEQRAAEIVRAHASAAFVSCSSAVLPRIREWPRFSTTMVNAYLAPVLSQYCRDLAIGLDGLGVTTLQRFLMQSNGGVMPLLANAETHTVRTLLSGPAAGVRGASYVLGQRQGWQNLITMDIGGTSCDIAFIESGEALEHAESVIDGRVVGVPALDISTIPAGGGSIAWASAGGKIEIGPRSAGATPGPVCYGRGGTEPTVTDANLVCGALNPDFFLGGSARLDLTAAQTALTKLAENAGLDLDAVASGVVRIVNARITDAIRIEAAKKGIDLADYTLLPFGGAGPVHAAMVAEDLGISRVLVPLNPGAFSALGLLCTDVRHDYMRSEMSDLKTLAPERADAAFSELEDNARAEIITEGLDAAEIRFQREVDLRYLGQGYELRVALPRAAELAHAPLDRAALDALVERFHQQHAAQHGHSARDTAVEIVSYRLRATVAMPKYEPAKAEATTTTTHAHSSRRVTFSPQRSLTAQVWRRDGLHSGWQAPGPVIIEQADATTLVPDGWRVSCDDYRNLVLERQTR